MDTIGRTILIATLSLLLGAPSAFATGVGNTDAVTSVAQALIKTKAAVLKGCLLVDPTGNIALTNCEGETLGRGLNCDALTTKALENEVKCSGGGSASVNVAVAAVNAGASLTVSAGLSFGKAQTIVTRVHIAGTAEGTNTKERCVEGIRDPIITDDACNAEFADYIVAATITFSQSASLQIQGGGTVNIEAEVGAKGGVQQPLCHKSKHAAPLACKIRLVPQAQCNDSETPTESDGTPAESDGTPPPAEERESEETPRAPGQE